MLFQTSASAFYHHFSITKLHNISGALNVVWFFNTDVVVKCANTCFEMTVILKQSILKVGFLDYWCVYHKNIVWCVLMKFLNIVSNNLGVRSHLEVRTGSSATPEIKLHIEPTPERPVGKPFNPAALSFYVCSQLLKSRLFVAQLGKTPPSGSAPEPPGTERARPAWPLERGHS